MIISMLLKASVLLAATCLIHAAFARRMSAAMRHWLWSLAIIGLLLLPALSLALPGWTVLEMPVPPVPETVPVVQSNPVSSPVADASAVAGDSASPRMSAIPWTIALPALYAAGVLLLLARVILERSRCNGSCDARPSSTMPTGQRCCTSARTCECPAHGQVLRTHSRRCDGIRDGTPDRRHPGRRRSLDAGPTPCGVAPRACPRCTIRLPPTNAGGNSVRVLLDTSDGLVAGPSSSRRARAGL